MLEHTLASSITHFIGECRLSNQLRDRPGQRARVFRRY